MVRLSNALVRSGFHLCLVVAAAWSALTACTENMGGYDRISVTVTGAGTGAGHVYASEPNVRIDCDFPSDAGCRDDFSEAGDGGTFSLTAFPFSGSAFGAWTGCTSTSANVCTLSFPAGAGNVDFAVTVRFDPEPARTTNTVRLYNATSRPAFLAMGTEAPRGNNFVPSQGSREVSIPTALGHMVTFRAYLLLAEAPAATITCTVTATAWQSGTHPLVIFDNASGNKLTCYEGLAAL